LEQRNGRTNLAAALTDETGSGVAVFASNPTFPAQINLTANSGYNIYASGTAGNYLAGSLGIGGVPAAGYKVLNYGSWTGASTFYGYSSQGNIQSDVTTTTYSYLSAPNTAAASFTLSNLIHYGSVGGVIGAGSSVTSQYGFHAASSLTVTGVTNNYGFYGAIAAAAGTVRYNLFMAGTADNYLAGSLGVGSIANASALLDVQSTTKGVRMPNMTTTQKNAISSPAAGLMVFDTTLSKLCVYSGAAWQTITSV
jgi:hypothetical protein